MPQNTQNKRKHHLYCGQGDRSQLHRSPDRQYICEIAPSIAAYRLETLSLMTRMIRVTKTVSSFEGGRDAYGLTRPAALIEGLQASGGYVHVGVA